MDNDNYYTIQGYMVNEMQLKGNELIVYAIINGFSQDEQSYCYSSLQHFCEWTNASKKTIQNAIDSLIEKDFIKRETFVENGVKKCRYSKNYHRGIVKITIPQQENKESNKENKVISNNNIINKDIVVLETTAPKKRIDIIKDIIDYLNNVTGSKYTYKSKATISHINARLDEGFTFDDFTIVICKKYNEWKDTRMAQYLRPETLFSTKFESYLNQPIMDNTIRGNNREFSDTKPTLDDILNSL